MKRSHYQENRIPSRGTSRTVYPGRSRQQVIIYKDRRGGRSDRHMPYSREDRSARRAIDQFSSLPLMTPSSAAESETYGLNMDFLRELGISLPLKDRIYIANIPKDVSIGDIYEICALAGRVTWFDVYLDQDNKRMGRAVCQYSQQLFYNNTLMVKIDFREKGSRTREGELPAGLSGVGLGLGLNGAPLNLMNPT